MKPLLKINNVSTYFHLQGRVIKAVESVDLRIGEGETVGLAGESGCGKSTLARAIINLVPPPGRIETGEILFQDKDIRTLSQNELRDIRGKYLSLIFQDPSTYLNPTVSVGQQICDVINAHTDKTFREAREQAIELLEQLGIPEPRHRFKNYPHELSGGMKQRILIAMAISCNAKLIIADEPTTALDVTIQRQILELIKNNIMREGSSLLFITHDLSVLAEICDRIYTMYAGRVVESGKAEDFFLSPMHPYTRKLLHAIPRHDIKQPLIEIPGSPPQLDNLPQGCSFYDRCDIRSNRCLQAYPQPRKVGEDHWVWCYHV